MDAAPMVKHGIDAVVQDWFGVQLNGLCKIWPDLARSRFFLTDNGYVYFYDELSTFSYYIERKSRAWGVGQSGSEALKSYIKSFREVTLFDMWLLPDSPLIFYQDVSSVEFSLPRQLGIDLTECAKRLNKFLGDAGKSPIMRCGKVQLASPAWAISNHRIIDEGGRASFTVECGVLSQQKLEAIKDAFEIVVSL